MYKRNAQGWSRHIDFILLDQVCLQLALILGVLLRTKTFAYAVPIYRNLALVMLLTNTVILLTRDTMHNVVSRGYLQELISTLKHTLYVYGVVTLYLFAMQYGDAYSRIAVFLSLIIYLIPVYTKALRIFLLARTYSSSIGITRSMFPAMMMFQDWIASASRKSAIPIGRVRKVSLLVMISGQK